MPSAIEGRESMALSQRDHYCAMCAYEWIRPGDQSAAGFARKCRHGRLDLRLVTHRHRRKLGGERCRGLFQIAQEGGVIWRCLRVEHERRPLDAGGDLLKYFQPFPKHRELDE